MTTTTIYKGKVYLSFVYEYNERKKKPEDTYPKGTVLKEINDVLKKHLPHRLIEIRELLENE